MCLCKERVMPQGLRRSLDEIALILGLAWDKHSGAKPRCTVPVNLYGDVHG